MPGSQQHFTSTVQSHTESNPAPARPHNPLSSPPSLPPAGRSTTSSTTSSVLTQKNRRKPSFAMKLHAILSDKNWVSFITWLPAGKSFAILDKEEFTKKCLPKYFREAKFDSFSRRLKRWGFRKIYMTSKLQVVYSHELFQRERLDLCKMMNGHGDIRNGESHDEKPVQWSASSMFKFPTTAANSQPDFGCDKLKLDPNESDTTELEASKLKRLAEANQANQNAIKHPEMQHQMPSRVPLRASLQAQFMMGGYQPSLSQQMHMGHVPMASMAFQDETTRFATSRQVQLNTNFCPSTVMHASYHAPLDPNSSISRELFNIEDEIYRCEEQLTILHRLKLLRSKYHALQR